MKETFMPAFHYIEPATFPPAATSPPAATVKAPSTVTSSPAAANRI